MSTASELLVDQPQAGFDGPAGQGRDISQESPSQTSSGDATSSDLVGAISNQPQAGSKGPEALPSWLQSVGDAELREFIQNKGWNDPAEMAVGYRNL